MEFNSDCCQHSPEISELNKKKKKKTVQKKIEKEAKSEKKQSFDKQQTINYILKFIHLISCYVL